MKWLSDNWKFICGAAVVVVWAGAMLAGQASLHTDVANQIDRADEHRQRLDQTDEKIETRVVKLEERTTKIDNKLTRIETLQVQQAKTLDRINNKMDSLLKRGR